MLSLQNQRQPKTTPLVDDYEISDTVLGLGINGKVVQCTNRRTKQNYALKVLLDNEKARREVDLHWRASGCKHIVNIIDVYENTYSGRKCLLVVMEWCVLTQTAFNPFELFGYLLIIKWRPIGIALTHFKMANPNTYSLTRLSHANQL